MQHENSHSADEEILKTRDVMLQLRPHIAADDYVATGRRMMRTGAFRLVAAVDTSGVRSVAGYRFLEMLYCGRILVIDDLVTDREARSRGYGRALLAWLKEEAQHRACDQIHLDSRVQRDRAHCFYSAKVLRSHVLISLRQLRIQRSDSAAARSRK